jgi:hypothetical protein
MKLLPIEEDQAHYGRLAIEILQLIQETVQQL